MSAASKEKRGLSLWCARLRFAPADQVVDHADLVALAEQEIDHVAADEPGAAGDDSGLARRRHFAPIFFMVRTL